MPGAFLVLGRILQAASCSDAAPQRPRRRSEIGARCRHKPRISALFICATMKRLVRGRQPRSNQTEVVRNKMVRRRLARVMLRRSSLQEMRRMACRFSPQLRLSEQDSEPVVTKQDSSRDLAARFLELKRLRQQLRVAQCGRVARWDEHSSVVKITER